MRSFGSSEVISVFKSKGYEVKDGILQMNIFGVRNNDPLSNAFDDTVGVLFRNREGNWRVNTYAATTDPGLYARENPMNQDGTAIICPAQHKKAYKFGQHKGQPAMEQINPMIYVRDANKNQILDFLYKLPGFKSFKQNGKTNIHRAGKDSKLVDKWSYGCQVFAKETDFESFLNLIKTSLAEGYTNEFDYTLLEIEDFNNDSKAQILS